MSIQEIELMYFRNHDRVKFDFSPGVNIIWGENGSGKTAIVEAIHLLSMGRSFRTHKRKDLLQYGRENFQIKGQFSNDKKTDCIRINQLADGKRKILINDVTIDGIKEMIGKHPVVILSPEEQNITKGSPQERRQYFDKIMSVVSSEYLEKLIRYQNILKQRNASLQLCKERRTDTVEVEAWEEPLGTAAIELWKLRVEMFDGLVKSYEQAVNDFGEKDVSLNVKYVKPNYASKEEFIKQLKTLRNKDIINAGTSEGPHRDRYLYSLNSKDLRSYASQGEHKLALILIKLAELYFMKERQDASPVFLLDDLLAKLDTKRAEKVIALLTKAAQTIITTTDLTYVNKWKTEESGNMINSIHLEKVCKA